MTDSTVKEPSLERINMIVTKYCNLHCRMCDFEKLRPSVEDPTLEKVKSIIREGSELGMQTIEISGGEPMKRKDIYEIIWYARSLGLKVFMASNGILIGKSEARMLIEAGLTSITISLEGPEAINDHIRGRGSYEKAMNAINFFLGSLEECPDFKAGVGITLSRSNYKLIAGFSKCLLEEAGVHYVSINPYNRTMLLPENQKSRENEFEMPLDELPELTAEIERLIEYSRENPWRLPPVSFLKRIPDYFRGEKIVPVRGCGIPSVFCGITLEGWVFPCWYNTPVGNVMEDSLKDILTSSYYRDLENQALEGKCSGCLSSCFAEAYSEQAE